MLYSTLTIYDSETLEFIEIIEECTSIIIKDNYIGVFYIDNCTNEEKHKRFNMKNKEFRIV